MADIAKRLQPQDIEALASWLAAQPVPSDSTPASAPRGAQDAAAGCGTAKAPQRP
jgi:cytochrome c553